MSNRAESPFFDEIRGILKEVSIGHKLAEKEIRELRASQKETDRQLKEFAVELKASQKETDRQLKEFAVELKASQKETDRQLKEFAVELKASRQETDRQIQKIGGRFNERWGRLVESLVAGSLLELLKARGIQVAQIFSNAEGRIEKEKGIFRKQEADIIAANGSEAVIVEVKTVLSPKKVSHFLESLQSFTRYFPGYKNKTLYGAVAYLRREDKADSFAEEKGLFVIRATGDSASIINQKDFKPKAFS